MGFRPALAAADLPPEEPTPAEIDGTPFCLIRLDDRIIAFIEAHESPASLSLITADRNLTERAEALGASVGRPGMLLERLDELNVPDEPATAGEDPSTGSEEAPA